MFFTTNDQILLHHQPQATGAGAPGRFKWMEKITDPPEPQAMFSWRLRLQQHRGAAANASPGERADGPSAKAAQCHGGSRVGPGPPS